MNKLRLTVFFLLIVFSGFCQQNHTVSGFVKDAESGEALIGATVYLEEISKGAATNVYGFYSFTVKSGSYHVKISYVGFKDHQQIIDLKDDVRLNVELSLDSDVLEEVVVEAEASDKNTSFR